MDGSGSNFDLERDQFEAARRDLLSIGREQARMDAIERVARLVEEAEDLGAEGASSIADVAAALQTRRAFALLYVLCLMAGRAGLATPALKQREIQALIELGRLGDAAHQARALADALEGQESKQARDLWGTSMGNLGRAHKQIYMNAVREKGAGDLADLKAAVEAYLAVWQRSPDTGATYQAINAAALIRRAVADRAATGETGPFWARRDEAEALAEAVLDLHSEDLRRALGEGSTPEDIWTLATCGEAFLVKDMMEDAARAYGAYAGNPANTAFNLASSLRQLEEVWGFSGKDRGHGGAIVRVLKAALLNLDAPGTGLAPARPAEEDLQTESVVMSVQEARLIESDLGEADAEGRGLAAGFEAYFDKRSAGRAAGAMVDITRLAGALRRARSLCAIEVVRHGQWQRIGTGFVVRGEALSEAWQGETLIVSNHHVTASSDALMSSSWRRCRAVFVDLDPHDGRETEHTISFSGLVWGSGELIHDTVVLKPADGLPDGVAALGPEDVSDYLPRRREIDRDGTDMHVVILGFPGGEGLKYAFGDELLLDHDACPPGRAPDVEACLDGRPIRLHYRTPSKPGSSGSPVFEAGSWQLVGIHHRGRPDTPRLAPKTDTYEANEGIWIPSIRAAIKAETGTGEFMAVAGAAVQLGRKLMEGADFEPPVFAEPLRPAGEPAPARPAASGLPGHYVVRPGDGPEITRRYLRTGRFDGDMETFRAATQGFETVIGDDNRTQIQDTAADPFRMICSLTIYYQGGLMNVGTGFLIGRRTLVTAGHCIRPHAGFAPAERIEVRPGRSGLFEPFSEELGEVYGAKTSLHPRWSGEFDPRFDVGAIHLDRDIGEALGWFAVQARPAGELERHWVHVTGYPGDKITPSSGPAPLRAAEMWHHATPLAAVDDGRAYYPADTFAGQSGAPVYLLDENRRPVVVAIHAYGIGQEAGTLAHSNNSGVLVDGALMQILSDWRTVE